MKMNKLVTICAVAAFMLAVTGAAQATEPSVWVNDNWTWDEIMDIYNYEYDDGLGLLDFIDFCIDFAIQEGIDGVDPGGTVYVLDGTYDENVVINKDGVTVEAHSSPIIDGEGTFTNPAIHVQAAGVKVEGFVIQNFIATGADQAGDIGAILVEGDNAKILGNIVRNITCTGTEGDCPAGLGIDVSANDVEVKGNEVYDISSIGIRVRARFENPEIQKTGILLEGNKVHDTGNSGVLLVGYLTGIEILGNEIYDSLAPTPYSLLMVPFSTHAPSDVLIEGNTIYNGYGNICLGGVTNVTVTGNTIRNAIPHYTDPDIKGKNIYIRDWSDVITTNVTITNNHIIDADGYGVMIKYNGSGDPSPMVSSTTVNYNNISGNTNGIENPIATTLDATNNWWGDASGPSGQGGGTGDAVSEYVNFFPWCLDETCVGRTEVAADFVVDDDWVGLPPYATVTVDGTDYYIGLNAFAVIQDAVDAAADGNTIKVLDGTYDEEVTINKANLTLQSMSMPVISPSTTPANHGAAIYISADGVTVDGFEIDGTTVCDNGIYGWETSGLTIKNNVIHGAVHGWDGCGILLISWGNAGTVYDNLIQNNEVYDTGRMGIMVMEYGSTWTLTSDITIKGNTVYDTWQVGWGDHGGSIQINGAKDCSITDNAVFDSNDRGIYMFCSASGNKIVGNTITNNPIGIQIWISGEDGDTFDWQGETPTSPMVISNNIYDNNTGVISTNIAGPNMVMDAEYNWWGDPSGPSGEGPGTGDEISASVSFDPWLTAPISDSEHLPLYLDGDLNYDGCVNVFDLMIFIGNWRKCK